MNTAVAVAESQILVELQGCIYSAEAHLDGSKTLTTTDGKLDLPSTFASTNFAAFSRCWYLFFSHESKVAIDLFFDGVTNVCTLILGPLQTRYKTAYNFISHIYILQKYFSRSFRDNNKNLAGSLKSCPILSGRVRTPVQGNFPVFIVLSHQVVEQTYRL